MPRRNRIPIEHIERIVCAFEDEAENYLLVADTLGVNRSTARGIVARYIRERRIRERPRGGRNNVLVDDEMKQCLENIINENCVLTLSQINGELRRRLPAKPLIHDRTVEIWKECCFALNWLGPSQQTETDVIFSKEDKNMETGS